LTKEDAPPEVVEAIRQIEERADACWQSLSILDVHTNVAVWAMLVGGIRMVEQEIALRGDNTLDLFATLQNVSRMLAIAVKWSHKHCKPVSRLAAMRWSTSLSAKVEEVLDVAHQYNAFEGAFPLWLCE